MHNTLLKSSTLSLLLAVFSLFAAQVSIDLSGTVTDKATARPIPNATVRLAIAKVSAKTDASGKYVLGGTYTDVHESTGIAGMANTPTIRNGSILFGVREGKRPVTAELFDLRGRLIERIVDKEYEPGSYRLTPTNRSMGQALCLRRRRS
jgi:hypothetical protein